MSKVGQPYTSGNWRVRSGEEDAFVAEWTVFTKWSRQHANGALWFVLIRDSGDPQRFVSFGAWSEPAAVAGWRDHPEFAERLGRCRALCDAFEAHDYDVAAAVD